MEISDSRALQAHAARVLADKQPSPKTIALIHAGAALGLSLILTVLNVYLSRQIDGTGGLAGMQTRSVLTTVQTLLQYASLVLLPVWELGFAAAALGWARGGQVTPRTLLGCFQKFWPVVRQLLLRMLLYLALAFLCAQVSMVLFMLLPVSAPLQEALLPLMQDATQLSQSFIFDESMLTPQLMQAMLPYAALMVLVYLALLIPVEYRLRMTNFLLLDDPKGRAMAAMAGSNRLMHRNCWKLFRLDLRFWWYYLLQGLAMALGYGDLLLTAAGVTLPISVDTAYFLFYGVYLAASLALSWYAESYVQTAYAVAYETLREAAAVPTEKKPPVPWDYEI